MREPAAWPLPWRIAAAAIIGRLQDGGGEVNAGHVGCVLGINHQVVKAALRRLEAEGLIGQTGADRYALADAERSRVFLQEVFESSDGRHRQPAETPAARHRP